MIQLREKNRAEHKFFEQSLAKTRDEMKANFNKFAADTHEEYQRLRQQVNGEKKLAVALLNELLEVNFDLTHILTARPRPDDSEAVARWIEAVEIQSRRRSKAAALAARHPTSLRRRDRLGLRPRTASNKASRQRPCAEGIPLLSSPNIVAASGGMRVRLRTSCCGGRR